MSERIDTNQATRSRTTKHTDGCQGAPRKRARERPAEPKIHERRRDRANDLAHASNRLIAQLNETWRVVDDPVQWRLQRKKGNPRSKNSGWRDRSFCTTRQGLLRCVREYCGALEPTALAKLAALPDHHNSTFATAEIFRTSDGEEA
jgi:hypothetical protein